MVTKKMYSYTKEILLSFASLPSCQSRPDGIDPALWRDSINSDVVEGSISIPVVPPARGLVRKDSDLGGYSKSPVDDIPEWRRPNGGGAIQQSGVRRKPYEEEPLGNAFSSSYPPRPSGPWVEHNSPARPPFDRSGLNGPPGRWDRGGERERERGRPPHDWDGDEPGVGDAGHRPWVERDGLLGSGNRPPPQGPSRMGRPVDNYQPPRPLIKTPPYGRREDNDIVNDETFGCLEASNDERAEQERKRRESFEMMRKEQHRQLQEQKQPQTKAENSVVNRKHDENSLWDNLSHQSPPLSPMGKTVAPTYPTTPRPAVPPGFSKVVQQRLNVSQSTQQQEDDAQGAQDLNSKDNSEEDHVLLDFERTDDAASSHSTSSIADVKEVKCATLVTKETILELDVVNTKAVGTEAVEDTIAKGALASVGCLSLTRSKEAPEIWSLNVESNHDGVSSSDIAAAEDVGSLQRETLLDKLFETAPSGLISDGVLPSSLSGVESSIGVAEDNSWSRNNSITSKFAQWFHSEEDKIPTSQASSSTTIISLFSRTDHSNIYDGFGSLEDSPESNAALGSVRKPGRNVLPMPMGPSLEDIEKGMTTFGEALNTKNHGSFQGGFKQSSNTAKDQARSLPPVFMTCEDIEQSLLAEAAGSDSQLTIGKAPFAFPVLETPPPPKDATSASQHLLALLQKRAPVLEGRLQTRSNEMEPSSGEMDGEWAWKRPESDKKHGNEVHTLETLFGKAFMSELRSAEALAPVSMLSDEGFTKQKSEGIVDAYSMQSGEALEQKTLSNGLDGPHDWFASSGPGWNSMWPDSKAVEAGGHQNVGHLFPEAQHNHPVSEDYENSTTGAPPMSGLWGQTGGIKSFNQVTMDSLNGATASVGGAPFRLALSEGLMNNNHIQNGNVTNSRDSEGEASSGEPSPAGCTNNRLLPKREKFSLLSRTSEAVRNIAVSVDSSKTLYPGKSLPETISRPKEHQVNGVIRNLVRGNMTQLKSTSGVTGSMSFPVEDPAQQSVSSMFRPVSLPGSSVQHLGTPPHLQQQQQRAPLGSVNPGFPHPTLRPQPQGPAFHNHGLDVGFDGFPPQQHIQPLPHAFQGRVTHPPPQFLGQPQILQRPPFYSGMIMQEREGLKQVGSVHVTPGQHVLNPMPSLGFVGPFNAEFARASGKSSALGGYNGAESVERWFAMDGRRSGHSGPDSIPQPPLGVDGDMQLRYG